MPTWIRSLEALTAVGAALVTGVFFAFSNFVMRGLGQRPGVEAAAAMRAINVTVLNPGFMLLFMGTALLSLIVGVVGVTRWSQAGAPALVVGALLYFVGTFIVTVALNVPLNDGLAKTAPTDPNAWSAYAGPWTLWNTVRCACSLLSFLAIGYALWQDATASTRTVRELAVRDAAAPPIVRSP